MQKTDNNFMCPYDNNTSKAQDNEKQQLRDNILIGNSMDVFIIAILGSFHAFRILSLVEPKINTLAQQQFGSNITSKEGTITICVF